MQREARVSPAIPLQASERARTGPYKDGQDRRREPSRPEDQPLILALVLVLIAITLYVFL
jgi:hypothetical protein